MGVRKQKRREWRRIGKQKKAEKDNGREQNKRTNAGKGKREDRGVVAFPAAPPSAGEGSSRARQWPRTQPPAKLDVAEPLAGCWLFGWRGAGRRR